VFTPYDCSASNGVKKDRCLPRTSVLQVTASKRIVTQQFAISRVSYGPEWMLFDSIIKFTIIIIDICSDGMTKNFSKKAYHAFLTCNNGQAECVQ